VTSDTAVTVAPSSTPAAGVQALSPVYALSAHDVTTGTSVEQFIAPPTLTLHYTAIDGVTPQIYYLDPMNGPTPIESTVDPATQTVSAHLAHFSDYLVGPAPTFQGTDQSDIATLKYQSSNNRLVLVFTGGPGVNQETDVTSTIVTINMKDGSDTLTIGDLGPFIGKLNLIGATGIKDTLIGPGPATTWSVDVGSSGTLTMLEGTGPGAKKVQSVFSGWEDLTLTFPSSPSNGAGVHVTQVTNGEIIAEPLKSGAFTTAHIADPKQVMAGGVNPSVTIATGAGDDTVLIDSLRVGFSPKLNVRTGEGSDSIVVAVDPALKARLLVDGGDGADRLEDYAGIDPAAIFNFELQQSGIPTFFEQGPGPIVNAGDLQFPVAGAIQTIAVDPLNNRSSTSERRTAASGGQSIAA